MGTLFHDSHVLTPYETGRNRTRDLTSRPRLRVPSRLRPTASELAAIAPGERRRFLLTIRGSVGTAIYNADTDETSQLQAIQLLARVGLSGRALSSRQLSILHVLPDLVPPRGMLDRLLAGLPPQRRVGVVLDATARVIMELAESPAVVSIEQEVTYRASLDIVSPMVGSSQAFQAGWTGRGIRVAVIDTGIDVSHPAFAGRISPLSRDFTSSTAVSDITDHDGHGTHVAGIIGGDGSPSGLFRGIAPAAELLVLKAYTSAENGRAGDVAAAVSYAIRNGTDVINVSGGFGPYGTPARQTRPPWVWSAHSTFEEAAFTAGLAMGAVMVVAAGNFGGLVPPESTITRPGIVEHVLTVGSVTLDAAGPQLSSFSSRGPVQRTDMLPLGAVDSADAEHLAGNQLIRMCKPDVVAPGGERSRPVPAGQCECPRGVGVTSAKATQAGAPWSTCKHPSEPYTSWSGTSMAAPVVAGIAALLIEKANAEGLELQRRDDRALVIQNIVKATARDLGMPRTAQGYGLVDWRSIEKVLANSGSGLDHLDNYRLAPVFPR